MHRDDPPVPAEECLGRAVSRAALGDDRGARRWLARALAADPPPDLRARILVHEAYQLAQTGSLPAALALLDEVEATEDLDPAVRGRALVNRGLLLARSGHGDALVAVDRALLVLPEAEQEARFVAHLNRGAMHLDERDLGAAADDFQRARNLAGKLGDEPGTAMSGANLAYVLMLRDDLPAALRELDAVAPALSRLSPVLAAKCVVNRAEVLLAAGLLDEAVADLRTAARTLGEQDSAQEQSEAEHHLARVHLALGEPEAALAAAAAAAQRFEAHGASARAARSRCLHLQARLALAADADADRSGLRALAQEALALASTFAATAMPHDERGARLLAAEVLVEAGDVTAARAAAGDALRLCPGEPSVERLRVHRLRARLARDQGRDAEARQELLDAFGHLRQQVGLLGSLELRTAIGVHAQQMAVAAVEHALAGGRPHEALAVADATRALSARPQRVTPPGDPLAAAWLEELRQIRTSQADLGAQVRPGDAARADELERLLRERAWQTEGGTGTAAPTATVDEVEHAVRAEGGSMLTLLLVGQRLVGLLLGADGVITYPAGQRSEVVGLARSVRADLDVLAGTGLPAAIRTVVERSSTAGLQRLSALLLPPDGLPPLGPLLVSPSAALSLVPWGLLPPLRGRAVTVSPTGSSWLSGRSSPAPPSPAVGVVLGPRLDHGQEEVRTVAAAWPAATVVVRATAGQALGLAARTDVFHAAAHGVHQPQSPLFSHLVMADGPLFGHEVHGLGSVPNHVVLSACELGCAETRPGDERLGMTAALLAAGVGSVVSGVARVDDRVSARVAGAHHRGLAAGLLPAQALALALAAEPPGAPPAPFVCFGSGW